MALHCFHGSQVKPNGLYACVLHFRLKEGQYMQYQILKEPMAILDIHLDNAETITAEAGAMVYMQGDIEIKTKTRAGGDSLES
jgi:Mitochondrial biogenesis AIM24